MSQYLIYVLHHPESPYVYIGQSTTGMRRPRKHFTPSAMKAEARLPKTKWIQSLRNRGLEAEIAVLKIVDDGKSLDDEEAFFVSYFRFLGIPLLNCTDGGGGNAGFKATDETRAKMSVKGKERAAIEPERYGEISRAYWADDAAREKQRQTRQGRKWSPEVKAKIAAAHKGRSKSPEHRAKLAEAAKLRCADPDYRQKQVEAQKLAQNREDVKAKKSEAAKRNWATRDYRAKRNTIADNGIVQLTLPINGTCDNKSPVTSEEPVNDFIEEGTAKPGDPDAESSS